VMTKKKIYSLLLLYLLTSYGDGQDYDYSTGEVDDMEEEDADYKAGDVTCSQCKCYNQSDATYLLDCRALNLDYIPGWLSELENYTDYPIALDMSVNRLEEVDSLPTMNLYSLDLSNNKLRKMGGAALAVFAKTLTQLDLSNNKLDVTGLEEGCFTGPVSEGNSSILPIQWLSLANNRIHTVRADLFGQLSELTYLNLAENPLSPMSQEIIEAISSLVTLRFFNISSTGLDALPVGLLSGMAHLEELDLSGNRFHQVDPMLRSLGSLQSLNLDNNLIKLVNRDSFNGMENLTILSLSSCHNFRSVEAGTFTPLPNLVNLRIANNHWFRWISPDAWPTDSDQPLKIQKLDLSGNQLRYLPSMLLHDFADWKEIDVIDIQNNPWWCDCHNEWLLNTLVPQIHQKTPQLAQNILCAGPRDTKLIKEELLVVNQITGPQNLPCDNQQFNPWLRNFNLSEPHSNAIAHPRPRQQSLPLAMTIICVFAIMGTTGMVGLLYLQRRNNLPKIRSGTGSAAPKIWYRVANAASPPGQPGLPCRGMENPEFKGDEGIESGEVKCTCPVPPSKPENDAADFRHHTTSSAGHHPLCEHGHDGFSC